MGHTVIWKYSLNDVYKWTERYGEQVYRIIVLNIYIYLKIIQSRWLHESSSPKFTNLFYNLLIFGVRLQSLNTENSVCLQQFSVFSSGFPV